MLFVLWEVLYSSEGMCFACVRSSASVRFRLARSSPRTEQTLFLDKQGLSWLPFRFLGAPRPGSHHPRVLLDDLAALWGCLGSPSRAQPLSTLVSRLRVCPFRRLLPVWRPPPDDGGFGVRVVTRIGNKTNRSPRSYHACMICCMVCVCPLRPPHS